MEQLSMLFNEVSESVSKIEGVKLVEPTKVYEWDYSNKFIELSTRRLEPLTMFKGLDLFIYDNIYKDSGYEAFEVVEGITGAIFCHITVDSKDKISARNNAIEKTRSTIKMLQDKGILEEIINRIAATITGISPRYEGKVTGEYSSLEDLKGLMVGDKVSYLDIRGGIHLHDEVIASKEEYASDFNAIKMFNNTIHMQIVPKAKEEEQAILEEPVCTQATTSEEAILDKTPSSIDDTWCEITSNSSCATDEIKSKIEKLIEKLNTVDKKDKKEIQENIKDLKAEKELLEAIDEQKFLDLQLEITEAAKEKIKQLKYEVSEEDVEEIVLNFQLYSFEYQYRESYYYKSFNEILEYAIYDYRCELNHCIQLSDLVDYANLLLYKPLKESLKTIQLAINSFLIGEIEELANSSFSTIVAHAGNNKFYTEPFEFFTGVKFPCEMNEQDVLNFFKNEKERINAEEVYEKRKTINISSKDISIFHRTIGVGYKLTLKKYGEATVTGISNIDGKSIISLESSYFDKMEISSSELSKELLWGNDLEQLNKSVKSSSDEEFKNNRDFLRSFYSNSSYSFKTTNIDPIENNYRYEYWDRCSKKASKLSTDEIIKYSLEAIMSSDSIMEAFKKSKREIIKSLKETNLTHSTSSLELSSDGYFTWGKLNLSKGGMEIKTQAKEQQPIILSWDQIYLKLEKTYREMIKIEKSYKQLTKNERSESEQLSLIELTGDMLKNMSSKVKNKLVEGQLSLFSI